MRTTYLSDKLLNHVYRNTAMTSPTTVYAALLTAVTDAEAGTVTEAAYTNYARQAITFGAPAGATGGRRIQNSSLAFPQAGSGPTTAIAIGVYDAATVGNLLDVVWIDGSVGLLVSAEAADLATDLLTSPGHGLASGQQVRFEISPDSPTLPVGLSENTNYFVIATGLTADQFKVSTTLGGSAVDITAIGTGRLYRLTPVVTNNGDTPQIAANALPLFDD